MASEKIDALELDITSKTSTENVDKLIDSLSRLSTELGKVKSKKVSVDIKQTGDASKSAATSINKLSGSFLTQAIRITAVIALFRKLSGVIADGVANSATYIKSLNMFTVSLGEYADNATKYGEAVSDALGIDIASWQKTQGIFQTLITGFGVTGDKAAYMSQNITQLTYDIASFYGITNDEAANKLKAALSGRLEPIRKLGYDLSQSKLVDIAKNPANYGKQTFSIDEETGAIKANTIATDENTKHKIVNFNQLTQQEKVQLRYIALMTQVTQVQGNYARALNDPANQMNVFKQQLDMTSRALGNIFIPILNKTLPYLSAFAQLAKEAFQSLANLMGFELPDMKDRTDISKNTKPYNDVVKATGNAAKNAKKMKDYMLGIDELNVFNPNTGAGAGGGASKGQNSNLKNLKLPGYDFLGKAVENSIKKAKENIQKFFDEWKKNPLELPIKIFALGAGELGANFWEGLLGKSPEQLAADADKWGMSIGQAFILSFTDATANKSADILGLLFGKSPEQLGIDAQACGMTVGEYLVDGYTQKMNSLGFTSTDSAQALLDTIFGTPDKLAARAAEAGRSVGEQFGLELLKKILKVFDNPVMKFLYEKTSGRNLASDIAGIEEKLNGSKKKTTATSYSNPEKNKDLWKINVSNLVDTAEVEKQGKLFDTSFSKGILDNKVIVNNAANGVFKTANSGLDDNGKAPEKIKSTSDKLTKAYYNRFTSKDTLTNVKNATSTMAGEGVKGIESKNKDYTNAGINNTAGYIKGIRALLKEVGEAGADIGAKAIEAAKKKTKTASPSKEFFEIGMFSALGYAEGVKDYTSSATDAVKRMANSSLKAMQFDPMTKAILSAPSTSNLSYGISAANEGAMASIASNIYQAVVSGIAGANVGSGNSGDIKVIIDGKEVFKAVQTESRKRGVAISNGAFSR